MNHREIAGLMAAIAPTIGDFVGKAMAPLRAENERLASSLAAVEQRFADFSASRDGDRLAFIGIIKDEIAKIEIPKDDKDADSEAIKAAVIDVVAEVLPGQVASAIEKIEKPKDGIDGKSVTLDEVAPLIEEAIAKIVALEGPQGLPGEPGKSVTVEEVLPAIEEMIEKKVSALPKAKDGKDGIGVAGAILGRDGELVLTLSDGSTKDLGVILGKDGEPGRPGVDGKDGVGFDDLEAVYDGERAVTLKFTRGDNVKEFSFKMPVVLDRGVFKEDRPQPYEKGDGVTFGGSFWIAQKDAPEGKPQDGSKDWRLSVKRGRNGADGVVKTIPPQGPVKSS